MMKLCKICQKEFIPNKYHADQQVCSQSRCQKQRQIHNQKDWRAKNPGYFKSLEQDPAWRKYRQRYAKLWKTSHKDHLKDYAERHRQERKEYMQAYMRKYRLAHKNASAKT